MRKFMSKLAIVSLIGLPIAAATAILPAGASTGIHYKVVGVHSLVRADQPNSNIVGQGSTAKFVPHALTVAEDTSGNNCSTGFTSFTIKNTGTKKAFITFGGAPFFTAAPGMQYGVCIYGGSAGATGTFHLSNKTNTTTYTGHLKITTSD